MSNEPIIDQEAIENLRALNPEDDSFLREIVGIFLEDTPARIAELKDSFARSDVAAFSRAAHSIKGSSSNLGASRLRKAAETLEHESKKGGLTGLDAFIPSLETEFSTAKAELEKLIA